VRDRREQLPQPLEDVGFDLRLLCLTERLGTLFQSARFTLSRPCNFANAMGFRRFTDGGVVAQHPLKDAEQHHSGNLVIELLKTVRPSHVCGAIL